MTDRWTSELLLRFINVGFEVVEVLTRICSLVLAGLDEPEESCCKQGSQNRSYPIDPMLGGKRSICHARPKASGRVERSTSIVYSYVRSASMESEMA